ncbi:Ankyrin repeat protein [Rickettsiales bacterium Ac37b]|nr:Ankyrin repeat protein [Rickettsiales bacterium Ac37b]
MVNQNFSMINPQHTQRLLDAASNGQLWSLKLLIEEIPDAAVRKQMIHAAHDEAFRLAARNGHREVLQLLLELTPNAADRERMIHEYNDDAFRLAAKNGHIKILELLLKSTPNQVKQKEMIGAKNEEIFKNVINKPIIQFLLSLVPEKWAMIKEHKNLYYYSGKILENSIELIQKFMNVSIEFPTMAINTLCSMQVFAQKIHNLILSSKTIIMLFPEPAMNSILHLLDDTKDGLLDYDRRCVLKAMTIISNNNESKLEVGFVDKILREKFPEKKKPSYPSIE